MVTTKKDKNVYLRNWWLGHEAFNIRIGTLPKKYWGRHVRIKIEVVPDDEIPAAEYKEKNKRLTRASSNKWDTIIYQDIITSTKQKKEDNKKHDEGEEEHE
jgi:hypothetical protein